MIETRIDYLRKICTEGTFIFCEYFPYFSLLYDPSKAENTDMNENFWTRHFRNTFCCFFQISTNSIICNIIILRLDSFAPFVYLFYALFRFLAHMIMYIYSYILI